MAKVEELPPQPASDCDNQDHDLSGAVTQLSRLRIASTPAPRSDYAQYHLILAHMAQDVNEICQALDKVAQVLEDISQILRKSGWTHDKSERKPTALRKCRSRIQNSDLAPSRPQRAKQIEGSPPAQGHSISRPDSPRGYLNLTSQLRGSTNESGLGEIAKERFSKYVKHLKASDIQ